MNAKKINMSNNLGGISKQISNERPDMRSGIMSLANFKHGMRFSSYIFGSNATDMRNDWIAVGNDIRKAINCHGR